MRKSGLDDLRDAVSRMAQGGSLWAPPRMEQVLYQGGMLVMQGRRTIFVHYDPSTGAHADLDEVIAIAGEASRRRWPF